MVEVDDVIVQGVGAEDEVADVLRVHRDFEADGVLDRAHRGDGVDGRWDRQMRWAKSQASRGSRPSR